MLGASSGAVRFGDALARGDAVGALSGAGGVIASAAAAARYLQAQAEVTQRVTGVAVAGPTETSSAASAGTTPTGTAQPVSAEGTPLPIDAPNQKVDALLARRAEVRAEMGRMERAENGAPLFAERYARLENEAAILELESQTTLSASRSGTGYAEPGDFRGWLRGLVGEAGLAQFEALSADEQRRAIAEAGPSFVASAQATGVTGTAQPWILFAGVRSPAATSVGVQQVADPGAQKKLPVVEAGDVQPMALKTKNVAFVGGFFDRTAGRIVYNEYENMQEFNRSTQAGLNIEYFTWDQGSKLAEFIRSNRGDVAVIGHSYGGDTAASVVARPGNRVTTLITLDPVSNFFRPDYAAVRANTGEWRNYNAVGGSSSERSNVVAGFGGSWDEKPSGYATVHQNVNLTHATIGGIQILRHLLPQVYNRIQSPAPGR